MATTNVNRPSGFRPLRYRNGSDWNGQFSLYQFSASNSVDAYIYDLVSFDSTNRTGALTDRYSPGHHCWEHVLDGCRRSYFFQFDL